MLEREFIKLIITLEACNLDQVVGKHWHSVLLNASSIRHAEGFMLIVILHAE